MKYTKIRVTVLAGMALIVAVAMVVIAVSPADALDVGKTVITPLALLLMKFAEKE